MRVSRSAETVMGVAMAGQPVPQHDFHRPLSVLLGTFFATGFKLDGLDELVLPAEAGASPFQTVFATIPTALVDWRQQEFTKRRSLPKKKDEGQPPVFPEQFTVL